MEDHGISRQPYLDIEDTIAEVDISRRQLGHWEAQGLIEPELGAGVNKFTVQDIRRLKALRRLIVEQKMPLAMVKELVGRGIDHSVDFGQSLLQTAALFEKPPLDLGNYVLDFGNQALSTRESVAKSWWNTFHAMADEKQLEQAVYELTLLLFRVVRLRNTGTNAFQERMEEILAKIAQMTEVARIDVEVRGDGPADLLARRSPILEGEDMWPSVFDLWHGFLREAKWLNKYREALEGSDVTASPEINSALGRFWDQKALDKVDKLPADWQNAPF